MAGLHLLPTGTLCTGLLLPATAMDRDWTETPVICGHSLLFIYSPVQKLK